MTRQIEVEWATPSAFRSLSELVDQFPQFAVDPLTQLVSDNQQNPTYLDTGE
jgi:hypothetical protein